METCFSQVKVQIFQTGIFCLKKDYTKNKGKSVFYKDATFYSTDEIYRFFRDNGFTIEKTYQTVFGALEQVQEIQQPELGSDKGVFVVISAIKV